MVFFVDGVAFYEHEHAVVAHDSRLQWAIELGQAWVYLRNVFGSKFRLQIGRQSLWEERNWWWDDDLNAVRLFYEAHRFDAEVAVTREVGRISTAATHDPEDRDIVRLLGHTAGSWNIWWMAPGLAGARSCSTSRRREKKSTTGVYLLGLSTL
jgi:hypothetical protein